MNQTRLLQRLLLLPGTFLILSSAIAQTYEQGRAAYIQGDYPAAYLILQPLAQAGDAEAQKMLGIMYDYGQGVSADPQQALDWYIRAAEQGQASVQYQVGAKYFRGENIPRNYAEAARWWQVASDNGQVDAQFNLGLMYFRGIGLTQDDVRAAEMFRQAAEQGHGHAEYSIAVMYAFGRGVAQNYDIALQWFNQAADKGIAQAQYNLGIFFENGYSVEKDLTRAKEWYERAAAEGLDEAKNRLATLDVSSTQSAPVTVTATTVSPAPPDVQTTPVSISTVESSASNYQLSEISTNNIKRESWVLQQQPDTYTIQIGSVTREDDLVNFIKANRLDDNSAYIQIVVDGITRFSGFYGVYTSYAEAEQAVANLPPAVRRINPWIRNFGIVQKMLN